MRLIGPTGRQFGANYVHVPTTGRYTLVLSGDEATADVGGTDPHHPQLLDTVVPVDGTPVTFSTTQPGEWVLAPMLVGDAV